MNLSRFVYVLVLFCALMTGCGSRGDAPPVIGRAYVAPATLEIRRDLGLGQPVVATVQHGDELDIVGRRRAFVCVRTDSGVIGWVDGRLLFDEKQMDELRDLSARAMEMPSQGRATVQEPLNVHTHANRQSPSFRRLMPGEPVDVVSHRIEPRLPFSPGRPASPTASAPVDDWSLIRMADGKAGWALFRMLYMSIPDEVAQYAEGAHITSYQSLGEVRTGDAVKHNWLWTTITRGMEPYEFDSFRVFVWSIRRHRYETAYIERNVRGYYPIKIHSQPGAPPEFSLVIEEEDGLRYQRTYAFQGYRVRMISKAPADRSEVSLDYRADDGNGSATSRGGGPSLFRRLIHWIKGKFGR